MTGADFYALCADANMRAMKRCIRAEEEKQGKHQAPAVITKVSSVVSAGLESPSSELSQDSRISPKGEVDILTAALNTEPLAALSTEVVDTPPTMSRHSITFRTSLVP